MSFPVIKPMLCNQMQEMSKKSSLKMSTSSVMVVLVLVCCIVQFGYAAKVVVDGASEWKNPVAQIGDSIIFSHKDHLKLYIFRNAETFRECNFARAFLLSKPNSASYTWNPSRPGVFYFSFSNGTNSECRKGQKWAIKVGSQVSKSTAPAAAPKLSPAPIPGGIISSSPGYKFPSLPPEGADSPGEIPGLVSQKGGGIAVIDSNPAVPLPTDAVDTSSTKQPSHASQSEQQVVRGFTSIHLSLCLFVYWML